MELLSGGKKLKAQFQGGRIMNEVVMKHYGCVKNNHTYVVVVV
jgi:hypothetical protein